jgi:hypothetical protein
MYDILHDAVNYNLFGEYGKIPKASGDDRAKLVRKILAKGHTYISESAFETACAFYSRSPQLVEILLSNGAKITKASFTKLLHGVPYLQEYNKVHSDLFSRFLNSGCELPDDLFNFACRAHNGEVNTHYLQILVSHLTMKFTTTEKDMVKLLQNSRRPVSHEIIKYIMKNGCPKSERVFLLLLKNHLKEHLKYFLFDAPGRRDFKIGDEALYACVRLNPFDIALFNMISSLAITDHDGRYVLLKQIHLFCIEQFNYYITIPVEYVTAISSISSFNNAMQNHKNYNVLNYAIRTGIHPRYIAIDMVGFSLEGENFFNKPIVSSNSEDWFLRISIRKILFDFTRFNRAFEVALGYACMYLDLSYVKSLRAAGCSLPEYALDLALRRANHEIATYLLEEGCQISRATFFQLTEGCFPHYLSDIVTLIVGYL